VSTAINQGKTTNLLKVECSGNVYTLFVNGAKLGEAIDNSFASGYLGLAVGTSSVGGVKINFDNLKVWAL
jgi:hypothetical protein